MKINRILKNFLIVKLLIFILIFDLFSLDKTFAQKSPAATDAHKAIVKVNTFILDDNFRLGIYGSGSGVIISSQGLILTNNHVVEVKDDFDDTEREAVYQICLTEKVTEEPDCAYTAKLISKDEALDIALMQIETIPGLSDKRNYPFLNLNQEDNVNTNDEVTAIGYPGIGGETITISKGIVSGKTEKDGKKWIKTDAVISFGSSGGAAVDKNEKVIGITTATAADAPGEMGYIANIVTINPWISENKDKVSQESWLKDRLTAFAYKEKNLKTSNKFEHEYPLFSLEKTDDWEFIYDTEDNIKVYNKKTTESYGENLAVSVLDTPYFYDFKDLDILIKAMEIISPYMFGNKIQEKEIEIGGHKAKLLTYVTGGMELNYIFLTYKNYILLCAYYYGQYDKGKPAIDKIVNSFKLNDIDKPFTEIKKYTHKNPAFELKVGNDWAIDLSNSKSSPFSIDNKKIKEVKAAFYIEKITENIKSLDNQAYLKYLKKNIEENNLVLKDDGMKMEILKTSTNFRLNNKFKNIIKVDTVRKKIEDKEILSYQSDFYLKAGDHYLTITLTSYGSDKKIYQKGIRELKKMIGGFKLGGK